MRMILARLTIFCGVFPSAISCCSCSRAFRSSTNRDSSCSIREMNHDHTRDSNVRDGTLAALPRVGLVWRLVAQAIQDDIKRGLKGGLYVERCRIEDDCVLGGPKWRRGARLVPLV